MHIQTQYQLSDEESKRIGILKFVSIILVVYIHSYNKGVNISNGNISMSLPIWLLTFENILSNGIARMAVPLFFLISSILLYKHEQNVKALYVKKTKRILVPYLFWNTLWIVIFFILQQNNFTRPYFSNPDNVVSNFEFQDWLRAYGFSLKGNPILYPLWFMRDLIVMYVFYPFFNTIISKWTRFSLLIGLIIIFVPFSFPFKVAIGFFFIGGCIVKFNWRMEKIDKIPFCVVFTLYNLLLLLHIFFSNSLISNLFILVGIIFFVKVSKLIYQQKWIGAVFDRLVPYTFMIYVGHEITLTSLKKICLKVFPNTPLFYFLEYFLLPIFVIIGCVIIGYLLKTYCKKLYSVITGEQ